MSSSSKSIAKVIETNPFKNNMQTLANITNTKESIQEVKENIFNFPLAESNKLKVLSNQDLMDMKVIKGKNFGCNFNLPELMGTVDQLIQVSQ